MSEEAPVPTGDFLASFKAFMDQAVAQAKPTPAAEASFLRRLRMHFDQDPAGLPVLGERFPQSEHPNLHLALEEYLAGDGRSAELVGLTMPYEHMSANLALLTQPSNQQWALPQEGPVEYVNVELDNHRVLACIQSGLYLITDGKRPLALLLRGPQPHEWQARISLEVMAQAREEAEAFLGQLRATMRRRNVYRGHIISLEAGQSGTQVRFHRLPPITRADIILAPGILGRIERHTIGFSRLADRLRAAGRHLKRGLLLYGPPGTGKTLTAMYLAGQMPDRTIILITGRSIGLIEQSCALARLLQPATVILEDVDLIAEERTQQSVGANVLLFELLNQMDGLADDADILFLLTTNRPELLEPALAARPGRVDQAVAIPLPDVESRRLLFELYGRGLRLALANVDRWLQQTEGVSAAFIRELLRRAALMAADEMADDGAGELVVTDAHVDQALQELVLDGGEMTRNLLGAGSASHAGD